MKINKIISELEKYAPLSLSREACEKLDLYDNSGWIVCAADSETDSVVFTLDLTACAVRKAYDFGAKLIITHHPAIYRPIKSITDGSVYECVRRGIGVYSSHLPLDTAPGGIEDGLCALLGGTNPTTIEKTDGIHGFGRLFEIEKRRFKDIETLVRNKLKTDKIISFGNDDAEIKTVASFCGAGLSEKQLSLASRADLFVSADIPHHTTLAALESGKCVLQLTHYASEYFAFSSFCARFADLLSDSDEKDKLNTYFCTDERFL